MIQVSFQNNPRDFLDKCGSHLEQNEAEHNLILSLCQKQTDTRGITLFDDDGFVASAVQASAHNIIVSKSDRPGAEKLAEVLIENKFSFPGIMGPSDVTAVFSNRWTSLTGKKFTEYMDQIIYELKKVTPPRPVEGELRFAKPEEAPLLAEWIIAFAKDALPRAEQIRPEDAPKRAEDLIRAGRIAVWAVKGKPVAKASAGGTSSVARIGGVYTPPEHRGHGYASALVAGLSQMQLDQGKKMCCLYADAKNPVSNSIYRKIGYEFVGRSSLCILES